MQTVAPFGQTNGVAASSVICMPTILSDNPRMTSADQAASLRLRQPLLLQVAAAVNQGYGARCRNQRVGARPVPPQPQASQ